LQRLSKESIQNKIGNISKEDEVTKILMSLLEKAIGEYPSLANIEDGLTEIFKTYRKNITEIILESRDSTECICSQCSQKMKIADRRFKGIQGLVKYKFRRRNFYCEKCKTYNKPLYETIDCTGNFSLEVKEAMTLLGQRVTFEESEFFLNKFLKVEVSHETIQEFTEKIGRRIAADEKIRVQKILNKDGYVISEETNNSLPKFGTAYMELDGSMVQTREENWKEVKNGILFTEKDRVQVDKNHKELLKKKYFSVFNESDNSQNNFNNRATQAANDFGFHLYEKQVILGDGAVSIWNYASTYHPHAIQILDYCHACEYLGDAIISLNLVTNEKEVREEKFVQLENGKIEEIIDWLYSQKQTQAIESCIRYFQNNKQRMRYGDYKKMGLDIGSGAIESAHRIIVQIRMKSSGMHWGIKNVQSIISLRAKYLSGEWDDVVGTYLRAA
jgi:hypothetical protein